MLIRPAHPAEVEALAALHVAGWQHGYRGLLPAAVLDALRPEDRYDRWRRSVADQDLPRRGTLVADDGAGLSGFASFGPVRGSDELIGEIYSFYVDPARWRQGVGRALMAAALGQLRQAGFGDAVLWVLDTNERAIGFYEALGWELDGATKPDVVGGVPITDARMRLRLPASSGGQ